MEELLDKRKEIQESANNQYLTIEPYLETTHKNRLSESKNKIDETPNIFVIGFNRFMERGENQNNALICLLLAIFNDGATILLGWVASRKSYSFLYVKSSKDYYNDIDDLFSVIFQSILYDFRLEITQGKFYGMELDKFTNECIIMISKTTQHIHDFLSLFALSECTVSLGYNLKYEYKETETKLEEYIPIVSVLLKTNLLKVIPKNYYRYLELEYYCGISKAAWKKDDYADEVKNNKFDDFSDELNAMKNLGNVLLLRNRAENYLRENMCSGFNIDNGSDQKK